MKKIRITFSILGVLVAVAGAFAFRPAGFSTVAPEDTQQNYVWIKYDCAANPAVVPGSSSNPNFVATTISDPAPFDNCGEETSACAIKYLVTQTTLNSAGYRTPNAGATQIDLAECE